MPKKLLWVGCGLGLGRFDDGEFAKRLRIVVWEAMQSGIRNEVCEVLVELPTRQLDDEAQRQLLEGR